MLLQLCAQRAARRVRPSITLWFQHPNPSPGPTLPQYPEHPLSTPSRSPSPPQPHTDLTRPSSSSTRLSRSRSASCSSRSCSRSCRFSPSNLCAFSFWFPRAARRSLSCPFRSHAARRRWAPPTGAAAGTGAAPQFPFPVLGAAVTVSALRGGPGREPALHSRRPHTARPPSPPRYLAPGQPERSVPAAGLGRGAVMRRRRSGPVSVGQSGDNAGPAGEEQAAGRGSGPYLLGSRRLRAGSRPLGRSSADREPRGGGGERRNHRHSRRGTDAPSRPHRRHCAPSFKLLSAARPLAAPPPITAIASSLSPAHLSLPTNPRDASLSADRMEVI